MRQRQGKGQGPPAASQGSGSHPKRPSKRSGSGSRAWRSAGMLAAALAVLALLYRVLGPRPPAVLDPFPGPQLKQLPQFGGEHEERLLWGTYRPGYYFGMRMRRPQSLLLGVMWMDPQRQDPLGNIRHEAQQRDGLAKYGWLQHDGQGYGLQRLQDEQYNITTAWAKRLCPACGLGGDWGVRLGFEELARPQQEPAGGQAAQQRRRLQQEADEYSDEEEEVEEAAEGAEEAQQPAVRPEAVSLLVYLASEDGSPLQLDAAALAAALQGPAGEGATQRQQSGPVMSGSAAPLGDWQLHVRQGASSGGQANRVVAASYMALATPHMHNLTDAVRQGLIASVQAQRARGQQQLALTLPNVAQRGANVAIVQITALLPLALDLVFVSGPQQQLAERVDAMSGAGLTSLLASGAAAFERRFASTFGAVASSSTSVPEGTAEVARAALGNMLGGMGYFYGHSLVRLQEKRGQEVVERTARLWDTSLYSAVPSRSFFPRGFLWDEGFHQLLVRRWDAAVSREVLGNWFDLMNAQGWIAREQILGEEARARVPGEFVRQSPDAANPPTFFLLLSDMSHRVAAAAQAQQWSEEDRADGDLLKAAWPRLRAWYRWFNTTQAGPVPGSYRWRGRDPSSSRELNPKTLTSGLDDAPRASHPSDDERHVDLRCWMALAARALATIGSNLGLPPKEVRPFLADAAWLEDFASLNALHLDEASGEYRDWGRHTEDVALQRPMRTLEDGRQVPVNGELRRVVTREQPRPQLVPQFGYINLFPLLMRLIPPDSPVLGRQLELLRDGSRLWTDYGLRSLSRSASLYQRHNTEHDPPYWRGAIWVNVNYLAVQALRHYGATPGPHAARAEELHAELRANLVSNIVAQYQRTGYLWEQYDDATGQGKGSHPFTGWTALVALLAGGQ